MQLRLLVWCVFAVLPSICSAQSEPAAKPDAKNVVLWISVDGFRGDYVNRGVTPFVDGLMKHGAYTRQLIPVFPSLTFPSHCSEATGVAPGVHGIVSNKSFDTAASQEFNMPAKPQLLQAEPIWLTATRQGVRTAVLDWPLSQGEQQLPGGPRAAYSNPRYDPAPTDLERVQKLVAVYRDDPARPPMAEPLRLLMGYVHDIDTAGHRHGPDAPETTEAVRKTDAVLQQIVGEVAEVFKREMQPQRGDALYIVLTTDHGMGPVKTLVNLRALIGGSEVPAAVRGPTSGSVANIYLSDVPADQRDAVKKTILANLAKAPYAKFWQRDDLPAQWKLNNPTRTGDIVVSLAPGYDFAERVEATTKPIEADSRASKGMHGYDPAEDKQMLGFAVICRYASDGAGKDLGPLDTLRIHPTVAKLLGISPASGATAAPIEIVP